MGLLQKEEWGFIINIKKYVVSLELAKRMKELGWKKETIFYWWQNTRTKNWRIINKKMPHGGEYSAPLFAEIWEELFAFIVIDNKTYDIEFVKDDSNTNYIAYKESIDSENISEPAGEMWVWLVENKYLKV